MAETRYISPKTGWKAELLQAAGGQRGLSTNRCTPQRAGLCKVTKQIGPADRGANSPEGKGKQRANKWEPAKGRNRQKIDKRCQT